MFQYKSIASATNDGAEQHTSNTEQSWCIVLNWMIKKKSGFRDNQLDLVVSYLH